MAAGISTILHIILSSLVLSGIQGRPLFEQEAIVHTIKTPKGQVFDCVDFYKQPAFSHPLLKNLTSQVKSSSSSIQGGQVTCLGLKDGGCPAGTVPILRAYNTTNEVVQPSVVKLLEHCTAVVQTRPNDSEKMFFGSDATLNLYKPKVYDSQWSAARIKLSSGPDSIEAGWMVNPDLFKDDEAHLYARFKAGLATCINLECPGFVQVSKDVPLGSIPDKYSVIDGEEHTWNISIDKSTDDGHWWLSIDNDKKPVGYWPKSLFSALEEFASKAEWGGEIHNPGIAYPAPDMGSGMQAHIVTSSSAYFLQVTVNEGVNNVSPKDTEIFYDCPTYYTVIGEGDTKLGRLIFYGGGQYHL